ncbi:uncharacterized protein IWZ02DRAFT_146570 [Phyllosticta citriasiana]|uniref:uncharacterized protein n=1 Tax=Phyllosticta citriasiana TaxID=595635 RepID=UPI0030FD76C4
MTFVCNTAARLCGILHRVRSSAKLPGRPTLGANECTYTPISLLTAQGRADTQIRSTLSSLKHAAVHASGETRQDAVQYKESQSSQPPSQTSPSVDYQERPPRRTRLHVSTRTTSEAAAAKFRPDVVEPSFASAVTHKKLCRALPSITPLPITLENLPTMASIKRLSKFETLSDELVNAVAKYLGNHDTMELRKTSKKMRDHLYSNTKVQACFNELEIPFASWEFLDMRILMKTPLASAIKSLKLFKTDDSDQIDQMMAFGSNVGDGNMATPGIRTKGGKVVIENAEEMEKALIERPQRLFADLVNDGFPNLMTIDFVCGKNLPLAQAGSLRDPRADDFEFLARVLKRTTQSLNVSLSYEKGSFRLMWAGSNPSTQSYCTQSLGHISSCARP